MTTVATKDVLSQRRRSSEPDPAVEEFKRDFVAKHGHLIAEPVNEATYREAIHELIKLAGTEPDLEAPPRRRFY